MLSTDVTRDGLERLATGASCEIYAWGADRVVKLFRRGFPREAIETELQHARLANALRIATPAVDGLVELDGRCGILLERCAGPTFYDLLRAGAPAPEALAEAFFELQQSIHSCQSASLQPVRERLARRIARATHAPESVRRRALDALAAIPDEDTLCHGDFHPINVIMTAKGAMVLDWLDAARGDPALDVTRTLLFLRHGRPGKLDERVRTAFADTYWRRCTERWSPRLERARLPATLARLAEVLEPRERDGLLGELAGSRP